MGRKQVVTRRRQQSSVLLLCAMVVCAWGVLYCAAVQERCVLWCTVVQ
jgi:hypothetical protein